MQDINLLSRRILWPLTIVIFAVAGSWVFKCVTPFIAIAVAAAVTTDRRRGALIVFGAWLANQAIGYGLSGYPVDAYSLGWGAAIGGGAMLAFVAARMVAGQGASLARTALAFVAGFAAYEGALYLVALAFGGLHTFSADIVFGILANDALWLAVLLAAHTALASASPRLFGKPLRLA